MSKVIKLFVLSMTIPVCMYAEKKPVRPIVKTQEVKKVESELKTLDERLGELRKRRETTAKKHSRHHAISRRAFIYKMPNAILLPVTESDAAQLENSLGQRHDITIKEKELSDVDAEQSNLFYLGRFTDPQDHHIKYAYLPHG